MFFVAFIFGFLTAALALILELILISPATLSGTMASAWNIKSLIVLAVIAVIEEVCKYIFLIRYLARYTTTAIQETILVGTSFGLGFATLELALAYSATDLSRSYSGLFGVALLHLVTSCVLVVLIQRVGRTSPTNIVVPLGIATGIHWLYNSVVYFLST